MLRHPLARAATVAALLVAAFGPSRAAAVTFDFEGQALGAPTPLSLVSDGLTATFAGATGIDPGAFEVSYNSSSGPFPVPYRALDVAFLTVGSAFGAVGGPLTVNFSAPLQAIQLSFALDDPANAAALSLATDAGGAASARGALAAGFRYPEGVLSFNGAPFTSIVLSSPALSFQVDNVVATAVPEPFSLALLGAGLASLGLARRRARG